MKKQITSILLAAVMTAGMVMPSTMVYAEDETKPVVTETEQPKEEAPKEDEKEQPKEDETPVVENVKVTFKLLEGALEGQEYKPVEVKKGEKLVKPQDPKAKETYKFVAWVIKEEGKEDVVFDFETALDKDIELSAKFEKDVDAIKKITNDKIAALGSLSSKRIDYFKDLVNKAELKDIESISNQAEIENDYKEAAIESINKFDDLTGDLIKRMATDIKDAKEFKDVDAVVSLAKDYAEASDDLKLETEVKFDKKDAKKAILNVVTEKPSDTKKVKVRVFSPENKIKLDYEKLVDKDGKVSFDIERAKEDYRVTVRVIVEEKDKETLNKNKSVKIANYDASMFEFEVKDFAISNKGRDRFVFTFTVKDAPRYMKVKVNDHVADYDFDYKTNDAKVSYELRDVRDTDEIKVNIFADGYKDYEDSVKVKDLSKVVSFKKYALGYPDGNFRPENTITRAEATAMFVRLERGTLSSSSKASYFKDVKSEWFAEDVNYAAEKGYIGGYPGGYFKPHDNMTREQFAQMISTYIVRNVDKKEGAKLPILKDLDEKHWSTSAIQEAVERGIIDGYKDYSFRGYQDITRAEAVKILNRVFGRETTQDSLVDNYNVYKLMTFNDVSTSHWAYYEILDAANTHQVNVLDANKVWID